LVTERRAEAMSSWFLRIASKARDIYGPWIGLYADNAFGRVALVHALHGRQIYYTATVKRDEREGTGVSRELIKWQGPRGAVKARVDIWDRQSQCSAVSFSDGGRDDAKTTIISSYHRHDAPLVPSTRARPRVGQRAGVAPRAVVLLEIFKAYNNRMQAIDRYSQMKSMFTCRQQVYSVGESCSRRLDANATRDIPKEIPGH